MEQGGKFEIPTFDESPAPPPVQETPKKAKPITISGFAEDALNDAFDLLKGLYQIIPSSVKSYQENIPKIFNEKSMKILSNDPSILAKAAGTTAKGIGEAMISGPKEHGWAYPLRRPVSFGLDLASVLSLGGGTAVKVGKLAGGTLKGADKASELVRAGTYIQELPGKVARGAVDKTVMGLSGGKWDLAKRREFLNLKRNEQARKLVMTEEDAKAFGAHAGKMSDEEAGILDKFIRQGATPEELLANPNAAEAFKFLKKLDAETWRPYLIQSRFKTEAELERALAKKYAYEVFGDTSKAKVDEAAEIIRKLREAEKRGLGLAPVYAPHIPEGRIKTLRADDLVDDLVSGGRVRTEGAVSALEEFGGKGKKYVKDPRKYVPAAIFAFRDLEAKTRLSSRLLQGKDLIKGGGDALTPENLFHNNKEGVYRKYYEDSIRAQALAQITDPTIQRLLRWEYIRTQHGLVRLYDRIMQLFSKMATRWNPKWQTGNVIGDAVLGTLMGSDWGAGMAAYKAGNAARLPYEAIARGGAGGLEGVRQMASSPKWVDRAFEIGEAADKATRAGIITRETARRLEATGYKVEASMDTLDEVLMSTREFSDVQVALQMLEENIARRSVTVQKIDATIARLEKREAALARRLEESERVRLTQNQERMLEFQTRPNRQGAALEERLESLSGAESKIEGRLSTLTSPEYSSAKALLETAAKREAIGKRAAALKAKLQQVVDELRDFEDTARTLSKANPQIVAYAERRLAKAAKKIDARLRRKYGDVPDAQRAAIMERVKAAFIQDGISKVKARFGTIRQRLQDSAQKLKSQFDAAVQEGKGVRQVAALGPSPRTTEKIGRRAEGAAKRLEEVASKKEEVAKALRERASAITSEEAALKQGLAAGRAGEPAFEKGLNDLNILRQRLVNLQAKKRAIVRDIADEMVKKGALDARIPDLKRQVDIVRPAIDRSNAAIGDYLGLDGFEQGVMKRLVPFYPWSRAMTMLAFRLPFLAPVKTMLWHRMSQFLFKMTEDPEMPDWMRGRVPVFGLKDGRQVWVNVASFSPFGGLSQTKFAGIPVPQMLNVVERNPMVALGFRYAGGKTIWDATSVPYGEPMVNMHDGTMVEFTRDGMLKKTIPQTPLVQGVVHFFPTTQLVEQILTPYWTNKYNWAGIPEPIYNPDGTYKYPKELWDRLSAGVGLNITTRSAEDLKRGERRKVYKALNELKTLYGRSTDPEEREMLRDVMNDYISEKRYRKFKGN